MLCLSYYAYVLSSTKLAIRAEQEARRREGWGWGTGDRNDTNNVSTCEKMEKKRG
jgi:hypothetical protein